MDDVTQSDFASSETEAASASEFETEAKAIEEDRLRAKKSAEPCLPRDRRGG